MQVEELLASLDGHDHLFEAAVASTLADPVDRALDLPRPRRHGGKAVSDSHAEIVVTVHGQHDLVDTLDMLSMQMNLQAVLENNDVSFAYIYDREGNVLHDGDPVIPTYGMDVGEILRNDHGVSVDGGS